MHFGSNHPLPTRIGVARTLFDRASNIVKDQDQLQKEKQHIKTSLKHCGYKRWGFNRAIRPRSSNRPRNNEKSGRGFVSVPYTSIQGISEPFKRLVSSLTECQVAFKGCNTVRGHLVHPKHQDDIGSRTHVVYKISCKDCSATYVGQTKRRLRDRLKEHRI